MGDSFLNLEKDIGIVQFFAQIFHERMDLGVDQKQFAAEAGLQEKSLVQDA